MEDVRILLSALWIALMLTYLLGDVLRIFAGDFKPGEIAGMKATQGMFLAVAFLMLLPIVMVLVSLVLERNLDRWANILAALGLFVVNLAGIRGYPGAYDRFLIAVGLGLNVLTIWTAWNWV